MDGSIGKLVLIGVISGSGQSASSSAPDFGDLAQGEGFPGQIMYKQHWPPTPRPLETKSLFYETRSPANSETSQAGSCDNSTSSTDIHNLTLFTNTKPPLQLTEIMCYNYSLLTEGKKLIEWICRTLRTPKLFLGFLLRPVAGPITTASRGTNSD